MKRSTRELVSVQIAGLLLAGVVFTTLVAATSATPAMLPGALHQESLWIDPSKPEILNCHPSQDGTFNAEAYLIFEAACRSTAMCLGIPIGVRGLPGVRMWTLSVETVMSSAAAPCRVREAVGPSGDNPEECPLVTQRKSRSEKTWTALRSGHR
jgi:hypothetical protein